MGDISKLRVARILYYGAKQPREVSLPRWRAIMKHMILWGLTIDNTKG